MAPEAQDWNNVPGHEDFLGLKNPDLLKPDVYPKIYKETFAGYYDRNHKTQDKIPELVAQDFPARKDVPVETSGPQGNVRPLTIIADPADWKASSWVGREAEYTYYLTPADLAEIDAGVAALKARGLHTEEDIKALKREDFDWPTLGPKLRELALNVSHGRGFQLIKGFPVKKYKDDRWGLIAAYWGFGLQLGKAQVNQHDYNSATGQVDGSILNHIVNLGYKVVEGIRPPHSGEGIVFHADQGATDIISLLGLSAAKKGGSAKWVSSIAIHNELLRRGRKDLVEVLSQPFKLPKMVTQLLEYRNEKGEREYEDLIPFEYHDGYLSVYYQSLQYFSVERDGLKLTPLQEEAVWAVMAIAENPEFHFKHTLQPGDIEWIHNPSIFHAREEYEDGEADNEKRHLIRWWVASDGNRRPVAPHYAPRSSVAAGGGFKVPPGTKLNLPLFPLGKAPN